MRIFILTVLSLSTLYCSPEHRHANSDSSTINKPVGGTDSDSSEDNRIPFSEVVVRVLQPAGCFDCHGKYKNIDNVRKVIVVGAPELSRFYLRASTDMPPIEEGYLPLSEEQLGVLSDWISQGARGD